jgi:hypothetical protein
MTGRLRPIFVAAGLLLAAAAGCGRKLPPEAPLEVLPARVDPLRVAQEGSDAVLRFPYPSKTSSGSPLQGLTKVTVYRELLPAQQGARVPPSPSGPQRDREEKQFLTRAEKVVELERAELDRFTSGGELIVRDSLSALFSGKRLGRVFLRYGVTATRDRKKVSELSPLVAVRPLAPPDAPDGLAALVTEGRVCLEWQPPTAMLDGSTPVVIGGYAIFRRECVPGAEPVYEDPIGFAKTAWHVDDQVQPDRVYCYTVRAAPSEEKPVVLGPPALEVAVDTRDVYPPPAPEGFQVLPEIDGNRLVWNPVLAPDLHHYVLYRRGGAPPAWEPLSVSETGTTWFDAGAPPDAVYAVSSVDRAGNESARAESTAGRQRSDP